MESDENTDGTTEFVGTATAPARENRYGTAWNFEESIHVRPGSDELRYTVHAVERALERKLPVLRVLPADARLADRDSHASVYKVCDETGGYFVVVAGANQVVTVFVKDDQLWERWHAGKARRREREAQGIGPGHPALLERWSPFADELLAAGRGFRPGTPRGLGSDLPGTARRRWSTRTARRHRPAFF